MIRKALKTDMPAMLGISQRSFDLAWSAASFEAEFYKSYSDIYIYEKGPQAVGYLIIWDLNEEGEIVSLAVDKGWRNRGIGTLLLEHVFKSYPTIKCWHLEVDPANIPALNLYQKNLFVKQRLIKNYYGQGKDAIQMIRMFNQGER